MMPGRLCRWEGRRSLARSRNYEVGIRTRPWGAEGLEFIATAWRIDLQSELVFVGDEGTTEIRGPSRRQGFELAARGQVWGPLYVNGSFTWTQAKFRNDDAIPLVPEFTAYGAAIVRWPDGLLSQLQATYVGVRPLIEDRSLRRHHGSSWTGLSDIDCRSHWHRAISRYFISSRIYSRRIGNKGSLHSNRGSEQSPPPSTGSISYQETHAHSWAVWPGIFNVTRVIF